MVLMRRRDKRRGNADDELTVASDSSIVANKGVRSLNGARSGRFAADMRANVGGYGRPDRTWGVDHPWHTTAQGELHASLCARDHMEDGTRVREQELEREAARGASRAALKKKKAKLKKQGLSSQEAAATAVKEAEAARHRHEEEMRQAEEKVARERAARKEKKLRHRQEQLSLMGEAAAGANAETEGESVAASEEKGEAGAEGTAPSKKKQKQKLKKQQAKRKAQAAQEAARATNSAEMESEDAGEKTLTAEEELQAREALATQLEASLGQEVTTASGLVIQDQRLGQGKLADVGEMLTVRYRGRLGRDGMVFGKGMLTTRFGTGSVIAGWEEGLGTMRPGGARLLTIPPELGYGASGKGGKIPANATLFFEVELVRLGKRKRDAVGEDDVPLPSSFQRKRIKQKSGKKPQADGANAAAGASGLSKSQKKRLRRKRKRLDSDAE